MSSAIFDIPEKELVKILISNEVRIAGMLEQLKSFDNVYGESKTLRHHNQVTNHIRDIYNEIDNQMYIVGHIKVSHPEFDNKYDELNTIKTLLQKTTGVLPYNIPSRRRK